MHAVATEPRARLWTREEYYKIASVGLFDGAHVELIEGRLLEGSPQGGTHFATVYRVAKRLEAVFGEAYWVRQQGPLNIGPRSDPEPDVAVVAGNWSRYDGEHPTAAVLVVEVSDTTLAFDRHDKANLYAGAGIPEYWICNLVEGQLEVRRSPQPDPDQPHGSGYARCEVLHKGEVVTAGAKPDVQIDVSDLLPG